MQLLSVSNHIQLMELCQATRLEGQKAVDLAVTGHVQMEQAFSRVGRKIEIPYFDF